LLAVFLNPIHAAFRKPRLWEAEGEIALNDKGLKVGCVTLTTVREIPLPTVTTEQRVRFGILCALEVCSEPSFVKWANAWLDGSDRSARSAESAAEWSASAAWAESAAWAWAESAWAESAAESAAELAAELAARSAARRSKAKFAEDVVQILVLMGAPASKYLRLTEALEPKK
jgi:hypothetical protein